MLAHLKAKQREHKPSGLGENIPADQPLHTTSNNENNTEYNDNNNNNVVVAQDQEDCPETQICAALRSLGESCGPPGMMERSSSPDYSCDDSFGNSSRKSGMGCPKQHQLPMFLSKTYHMIDRCDPTIASWSPKGDNFVVKNVEKFATAVLPMYFKHSNFSSFARQLNFYGFRKLKAEPILTADFDARTACYVRFYHEKFQKDRPELLTQIKRATKSDQQSKDDVDSLRMEICKLRDCMTSMGADYDRRMSEMSYEYNRRITQLSAEYDKLAVLVQQIASQQGTGGTESQTTTRRHVGTGNGVPDMMHSLSQVAAMSLQNCMRPPSISAAAAAALSAGSQKRSHESDPSGSDTCRARLG